MGVDFVVLGDDRALRTDGIEGVIVIDTLGFCGEVKSENCEGLEHPSLCLAFLLGELKSEGSRFSESSSSKTDGAWRRFPVAGVVCLRGDANDGAIASFPGLVGYLRWIDLQKLTILPVLGAGKILHPRTAEFGKWLARGESHFDGENT